MPSGKGALRIAIEDFLETFNLGNVLYRWYTNLLDSFEADLYNLYSNMYNKYPYKEYLPDFLSPNQLFETPPRQAVQVLPIVGAILMMLLGLFIGSFRPLSNIATYWVENKVHSARLSPGDAYNMLYRKAISQDELKKHLLDTGWSEDIINAYNVITKMMLSPLDYITAARRGVITESEANDKLSMLGFSADSIEQLKRITEVIPGVSDLIRMAVREAFSPDVIERFQYGEGFPNEILVHTRKIGLPDDWVRRYWYAHWELPSPQLGFEMLHRLRPGRTQKTFTRDDLELLLRTADYAPYFRDKMIEVSYNPITRVDIRRMYKLGVFDREEVKQRYMDLGYTEADAEALTEFTVRYESEDGSNVKEKIKELTLSAATRMYKKQVIDENEYRNRLRKLDYSDDVIDLYVQLAHYEMSEELAPDYRSEYVKSMLTDIRKAYNSRMIDEDDARLLMTELGLSSEQIDYIVQAEDFQADLYDLNDTLKLITDSYISGSITRDDFISKLSQLGLSGGQLQKIIQHVELQLQYRNRRLTEAQYRAAALKGVITADEYKKALVGLGYTDKDIDILVELYGI